MVMVDRNDHPQKWLRAKDAFKQREVFYDVVDEYWNEDFWKGYNIIEPSESLESAVKKLKKQKKINWITELLWQSFDIFESCRFSGFDYFLYTLYAARYTKRGGDGRKDSYHDVQNFAPKFFLVVFHFLIYDVWFMIGNNIFVDTLVVSFWAKRRISVS